jgi:hypothetical protein
LHSTRSINSSSSIPIRGAPFFGDRILVVHPLTVVFSINVMDMQVVVEMVW